MAVLGLIVNGAPVFILGHQHEHDDYAHSHGHDAHGHHHHDHNLRSAYLHVLADALTSVLAIVALLAAKYFGLIWMDPLMGIVGALLVSWWSLGLLRATSRVLLDNQGPQHLQECIREAIEGERDNRVVYLHLWSVGPNIHAVIIALVTHHPQPPEHYEALLPEGLGLVHVTVEVHECGAPQPELRTG